MQLISAFYVLSDEVVSNVLSKIDNLVPFTVIFTAQKPSVVRVTSDSLIVYLNPNKIVL